MCMGVTLLCIDQLPASDSVAVARRLPREKVDYELCELEMDNIILSQFPNLQYDTAGSHTNNGYKSRQSVCPYFFNRKGPNRRNV